MFPTSEKSVPRLIKMSRWPLSKVWSDEFVQLFKSFSVGTSREKSQNYLIFFSISKLTAGWSFKCEFQRLPRVAIGASLNFCFVIIATLEIFEIEVRIRSSLGSNQMIFEPNFGSLQWDRVDWEQPVELARCTPIKNRWDFEIVWVWNETYWRMSWRRCNRWSGVE